MFTNRRPAPTQFERTSPRPPATTPPRRLAPYWRVAVEFVADGERETRTRVYQAASRDDALQAALDDFTTDCGPPDDLAVRSIARVAAPRD